MSATGSSIGHILQNPETSNPVKARFGVWLLPLAIVVGFALLFGLLFRDRLLPAKEVAVFPALAIEEKIDAQSVVKNTSEKTGNLLFQASGWVEPDPLPTKATALTDGIVDKVHVLQGQLVKKGDLLATLIETDTRIERDLMAANLAEMKATFDAHCVGTQITLQKIEIAKAELAVAEADAAESENKLGRYGRLSKGTITEDERIAVRFDHDRKLAAVAAAEARIKENAEMMNKIAYEALSIQSKVKASQSDLEKAELAHSRTKITAPSDGRILALKAAPGQKKMVGMDDEDSSTIAILYDPAHLQVRVDVPLADAGGLGVGQRAKIRCNLLPDEVFEGEVTRIEGAADLQRNTLQAKVRIEDPSEKLRPEMLCRVEFFETVAASGTTESVVTETTGISVYLPENAISDGSVWICDPDSRRAKKRMVSVSSKREGFIRVDEGIRPGEWVVADPSGIKSGQRLKPLFNN